MNMNPKQAYDDLMTEIFKYDNNPTYELSAITLDNRYGVSTVLDMEKEGYIKRVGKHNGHTIYKIR